MANTLLSTLSRTAVRAKLVERAEPVEQVEHIEQVEPVEQVEQTKLVERAEHIDESRGQLSASEGVRRLSELKPTSV